MQDNDKCKHIIRRYKDYIISVTQRQYKLFRDYRYTRMNERTVTALMTRDKSIQRSLGRILQFELKCSTKLPKLDRVVWVTEIYVIQEVRLAYTGLTTIMRIFKELPGKMLAKCNTLSLQWRKISPERK